MVVVLIPACQATWADGPVRHPYAGVDFILLSWIYEFGDRRRGVMHLG
jgi:hypothetical protein